ncbi:MAG: HIT domain-containing protein [Planctomycetia bacterium]|nr:HIT domain-containing protein [Planctomycetia bacterium]
MVRQEQLWAPWRLAYISGEAGAPAEPADKSELQFPPGADPECFICRGIADSADRENLIVERTANSVVIVNRFPYNNGHLLVAPLAHKGRPDDLSNHEHLDLQQLITKYVALVERLMNAEGFNIGLNLGRVAGAGLPGHLHWHIVPRWNGDTNFMPSVAGVKVMPQALDALWEIIHQANAPGNRGKSN